MLLPFKIMKTIDPILVENQRKVDHHLEAASIHHDKAAAYLQEGEYQKAAENAILAQKYLDLASDAMKEEIHPET